MALPWPSILKPRSESWRLQNADRSGGPSITGAEQIVSSVAARWAASLTISVTRNEQVLAFRGLMAGLDGRAGTMLVGPTELCRAPWGVDALGRKLSLRSYRDPVLKGTIFDKTPEQVVAEQIAATVPYFADAGSTVVTLRVLKGAPPTIGSYIGFENRMHVIVGISVQTTGALGETIITYIIRPGLRFAMNAGHLAELVFPLCEMRLANNDTGNLEIELARFGSTTLELVEAF